MAPRGPLRLLAAVPAIITPILAAIPAAAHTPNGDGGRAGDRSRPDDRSPSH
jgi:hypothetical protein